MVLTEVILFQLFIYLKWYNSEIKNVQSFGANVNGLEKKEGLRHLIKF